MAEAKAELKGAKEPKPAKSSVHIALVGGNLADGSRFEEGDKLSGVSAEEIKALKEMGAIAEDK